MTSAKKLSLCSWSVSVIKSSRKQSYHFGLSLMRLSRLDLTVAWLKWSLILSLSLGSRRRQVTMQRSSTISTASTARQAQRSTSKQWKTSLTHCVHTAWFVTSFRLRTVTMRTSWLTLRAMCSTSTSASCYQTPRVRAWSSRQRPLSWPKRCWMSWVARILINSETSEWEWRVVSAPSRRMQRRS